MVTTTLKAILCLALIIFILKTPVILSVLVLVVKAIGIAVGALVVGFVSFSKLGL